MVLSDQESGEKRFADSYLESLKLETSQTQSPDQEHPSALYPQSGAQGNKNGESFLSSGWLVTR